MASAATTVDGRVRSDAIIVGAGPAGLAVAACLKQAGIPSVILDRADQVGASWHGHYQRLHLHTAKAYSALPFLPFPADCPRYPSRLQVIEYLQAYARRFELQPRFGQQVLAAHRVGDGWEVQTGDTRYQASNLVIAAGYNREPFVPEWPGQSLFHGAVLHSSRYRSGETFKGQSVLVVGFGNSGGEIAIDLHEQGANVALSVRGPVNVIPRELFGIPVLAIGIAQRKLAPRWADTLNAPLLRAVIGDLSRYGLRQLPRGPLAQIRHDARIPLIDVGTIKLIKQGKIIVYSGIEKFTASGVVFSDGRQADFDAVVLATGYRPRVDAFLQETPAACDAAGTPLSSGKASPLPGLYFCGYHVAATGMLREIALEAQRIGAAIAEERGRVSAA
jgi:cation diffusion facilitator CzcD-associated flavoprotein CzcO